MVGGTQTTEEDALDLIAAEVPEPTELGSAFDAFGDADHAQRAREIDDSTDDGGVSGTRLERGDVRLIDLHDVHGLAAELGERRTLLAEIVDRHGDTELP
jgi:hypothetical protein